jgi:YegS/Rv2252/BmrU family lipid kinase
MDKVENILVLVNPAASDNAGRQVWVQLRQCFDALFSGYNYKVVETESREQSVECGASSDADLIISVSGDGTLHDIAQGVLQRPRPERPLLTVIPIGSGNDFAKTLGLPSDPTRALQAISDGIRVSIDVGRCVSNGDSNSGIIFLQTLSFGIDAAIALKTMEKRRESKRRGFLLYASVAVPAILNDLRPHGIQITADGQSLADDRLLICAVQNGPSYGGGFQIAPSALADDGLLNICTAKDTSTPHALYALSLIARGKHERLEIMRTLRARQLTIELDEPVPAQIDGELLTGTRFQIDILPQALDVIATGQAAVQRRVPSA